MADGTQPVKRIRSPYESLIPDNKDYLYQSTIELTFLVESWENLDLNRFPHLAENRKRVLEEWGKRKALHGRHVSTDIFMENQDFLDMLVTLKYSPVDVANPNALLSVISPGRCEPVWATPAMGNVEFVSEVSEEVRELRHTAVLLVLLYRLYSDKLDVSRLPLPKPGAFMDIVSHQAVPNGPKRYYKLRIDNELYCSQSWTVRMSCDGELPPLTQDDLDKILINPYCTEHISSIVDTKRFIFNGLMFCWGEEITFSYHQNQFRNRLEQSCYLSKIHQVEELEQHLKRSTQQDLRVGLVLTPHGKVGRQAVFRPHLKSLRFNNDVDPSKLEKNDPYLKAFSHRVMIKAPKDLKALGLQQKDGIKSMMICILRHYDEVVGLIEFGSRSVDAFDFYVTSQCMNISGFVAKALKRIVDSEQERVMAVIKQTCTAIHPSVEWRFELMARNYMSVCHKGGVHHPEPVVFKQVIPLFGVSDIRSSSRMRNESIQADLTRQLELAANIINAADTVQSKPIFDELGFRIQNHREAIVSGLKSGDEVRIYAFLKHVVEPAFDELAAMAPSVQKNVERYRDAIDSEVGVVYDVRKDYDNSVTLINDTVGAFIDGQQELAQAMIPHYFEKFKTDGVDHNIYVGDALMESGRCSPLDLRNLYLWQLMTMCGVVWLTRRLKKELPTPLETAHLILVQSSPLNITFQMEEKHFSVDGAYNARYEIVKKRIDKAKIRETGERLTQPEQIAIVYTQERELSMYKEFISYLQKLGYLKASFIDVLLEDLQGVHGLRALRVEVAEVPPKGWNDFNNQPKLGIGGRKKSR